VDQHAGDTYTCHAIAAGLALIQPGHPELWTALASLATALAGAFRLNHGRIRKLQREVKILKMQVEVQRQLLAANGMHYDRRLSSRE
jgi:hypothetical protein